MPKLLHFINKFFNEYEIVSGNVCLFSRQWRSDPLARLVRGAEEKRKQGHEGLGEPAHHIGQSTSSPGHASAGKWNWQPLGYNYSAIMRPYEIMFYL